MADGRTGADENREGSSFGSLGVALGSLIVAWGVAVASFPLNDNSFLTHLATGRLILDRGSVPTSDPYTFTAAGTEWTVQSWLPSVVYAAAERVAGGTGLRFLVVGIFALTALLMWRLTRPARSIIPRLLLASISMLIATTAWSERPFMVGVIGLGLVWITTNGGLPTWVLVPVMWIWANSHGSYPLALVLASCLIVGSALDKRGRTKDCGSVAGQHVERSAVLWIAAGSAIAAIGPLGIEVFTFPIKSLTRSDLLSEIVEWRSPAFQSIQDRAFLLLLLAAFAGVVRVASWRLALPTLIFAGAALVAQRNIVMSVMVLVPVLAESAPTLGSLLASTRLRGGALLSASAGAVVLVVGLRAFTVPLTNLEPYPAVALAWTAASADLDTSKRTATQDFAGNLLEVLDGPSGRVFLDDRADMFPKQFFEDAVALAAGEARWNEVLCRYEIDEVVWKRSTPVGSLLAASPGWQLVYNDTDWLVARRRVESC